MQFIYSRKYVYHHAQPMPAAVATSVFVITALPLLLEPPSPELLPCIRAASVEGGCSSPTTDCSVRPPNNSDGDSQG